MQERDLFEEAFAGAFSISDFPYFLRSVINIALLLAGVVAVIFLIYGGYMYVTAGGNAEQAANARTAIFNSIIGLAVILAAYAIISWLINKLTIGY